MQHRAEGRVASSRGPADPPRHQIHLYEDAAAQASMAARFVADGLAAGERCAYIGPPPARDGVAAALGRLGVDVARETERGALALLDDGETYLGPGRFDPDRTIAAAQAFGRAAAAAGFTGSRLVGDAAAALSGAPGVERVVEYEARLDPALRGTGTAVLCQYDRRRFPASFLLAVVRLHPRLASGGDPLVGAVYASDEGESTPEEDLERLLRAAELGEALRESEQRLRVVLETGGHAMWEWDPSDAWRGDPGRLIGWAPGEIPPTLDGWRAIIHPDDLERTVSEFARHVEGRSPQFWGEYRARARDGDWRWLLSRGRAVSRDRSGRATRVLGTITDVTAEHRLHAHALAADRLASVGTLAGGVAHEINNPLACVWSNLKVVAEELAIAAKLPGGPGLLRSVGGALGDAIQGAARVRDIVQGLQHFAREPRGRPEPVNVRAELDAAVEVTRDEVARRARLVVDLPASLPAVIAVPYEIGQAFVALLLNAADAIPPGDSASNEVHVVARAARGEVAVEISDTGSGIPAESLPRIFDPFFTTKPAGTGRGLGLSASHGIVSRAGGRIEVETEPGHGSIFRVVLPAVGENAPPSP